MKIQIKFLTLFSSFLIITLVLFSCAKEEIQPFTKANQAITTSEIKDYSLQDSDLKILADEMGNELGPDMNITLAEALESIDPDVHPKLGVSLKTFVCFRSGESLLIYNPNALDPDFYDSPRFAIYWFKNGKPIKGTNRIECACQGKYAAIVVNRYTKQGIGIVFYSILNACYETDKVATSTVVN